MLTQPYFRSNDFYRRISSYNTFAAGSSYNQVIAPNSMGMTTSFATYSSNRVNIAQDGKYRLIFDAYVKGQWNNANLQTGSCLWGIEKNGSTNIAVMSASFAGSGSSLSNGFSTMQYLNNGGTAISGTNPVGGTNSILWDAKFFYSGELSLLNGDYFQIRYQQMSWASGIGHLGIDGYWSLFRVT